jgi:hypothetical protein
MASEQAESLIDYASAEGRICPQPMAWDRLWRILLKQAGALPGVEKPPPPLILGAWHFATGLEKMIRLKQHIQWAEYHGIIEEVEAVLRGLPENDWFHGHD